MEPVTIGDRDLVRLYFFSAFAAIGGILFLFFYSCPYFFKVGIVILLAIGIPHLRKAFVIRRFFKGLKELKTFNLPISKIPEKKDSLYIGKGFIWDNRQTQLVHALTQESIKKYLPDNKELGGRSIFQGVGSDVEENIFLPISEFTSHLSLMGSTRMGKTRFLESPLSQIIKKGDSLIIIDPKGEKRLENFCYSQAIASGRKDDFVIFDPTHPQISATYNPLSDYVSVTDIADRIVALLPQGGESQAFTDFCHNVILAIAESLDRIGEKTTFIKIEQYAFSIREQDRLLIKVIKVFLHEIEKNYNIKFSNLETDMVKSWIDEYYRALKEAREKLGDSVAGDKACEDLLKFHFHPHENFMKMSNELGPLLAKFNTGKYRRLLSSPFPDIHWRKMLDEDHKIIYFYLGSLVELETSYAFGRMALQDLISYIGRRYVYSTKRHPIWLVIDEFHNVVYPGFVDLISKAGGAGLRVLISMQSLADLEANMKWGARAHAQQILDNTGTKICMRVADRYTADRFTSITGRVSIGTRSESADVTPEVDDSQEVFDTRFRTTTRQMEVPLVRSNWLNEIPKGEAFMYHQGKTFKLKFPLFPEPERDFLKEKINEKTKKEQLS